MPSISDAQNKIFLESARASCFSKDLLEFVSDGRGGYIRNSEFDNCVSKEYNRIARKNTVNQWFSNEGGISGLLQSFTNTAAQVQGIGSQQFGIPGSQVPGTTPVVTYDQSGNVVYTGQPGQYGQNPQSRTSPMVWIAIILVIILLIWLIVSALKKSVAKKG